MSILTDRISFTGTPSDNDVLHIVIVSDPTDNPAGTSYKIPLSGLTNYFGVSYWTSGSTGVGSIKTILGSTSATNDYAVAEGRQTLASGTYSHAEGLQTEASGSAAHAEGNGTIASGTSAHAEGTDTMAIGDYSHAEGWGSSATTQSAHAEGTATLASAIDAHAEGTNTKATGLHSHAEGVNTIASGDSAHAEGAMTVAGGAYSHAGGCGTGTTIGAYGVGSFIHFCGEISGATFGAFADNSVILGGANHLITSGGTNSVILGGTGITASTPDMVHVPNLYIDNCPAYADDAAAGVGGLTTGMVYQTTGAGGAPLNVAGILMIKQ